MGLCGACTVHINGNAGALLRHAGLGRRQADITTIEAVGDNGRRQEGAGRLARSWTSCSVATARPARSCPPRRCSPSTPKPTDKDIDDAMSGNICRCATYTRIRAAIKQAAGLPTEDKREVV